MPIKPEVGTRSSEPRVVHVAVEMNARDEVRAAAMNALLQGQSVTSVATEYNVNKGTVSKWRKQAMERGQVATVGQRATKKEAIGQLLYDYLGASLKALKVQQEVFSDPAWLRTQDASQLAVLHGVTVDKVVRMLEALGGAEEESG